MPLQGKVGKGLKPSQKGDALAGQGGEGLSPLEREMPLQGSSGFGTGYKFVEMNCKKEGRLGVNPITL
jgi:hypothetical protein